MTVIILDALLYCWPHTGRFSGDEVTLKMFCDYYSSVCVEKELFKVQENFV
jgi:hypothetical protein